MDESIDQILVARVAAFNDDIVHGRGEPGVANERQPKGMTLLVAVSAITERDHVVRTKRVNDCRNRVDRDRRRYRPTPLCDVRSGGKPDEGEEQLGRTIRCMAGFVALVRVFSAQRFK
ncbi:MAG: hypothetical protein WCG92_24020 [Hyphomicrobiales bacterium]